MTHDRPSRPPLDPDRLARLLAGSGLRAQVSAADPSTNATAAALAVAGEPEGLVVVTEHQTAGRGRLDRTWQTPDRAALTFSLLLRPAAPAQRWPWLPLLAGYAVARGLRAAGVPADLKWPNDVLVDELKVAGILLERVDTGHGPAAVVGIGLNVSQLAEELPVDTATSILRATGTEPDRTALLADLLARLWEGYGAWSVGDEDLAAAYASACVTVGRRVRVELPRGEPLLGEATGVDEHGRLLVRGPGGPVAVSAADVVHVRGAG